MVKKFKLQIAIQKIGEILKIGKALFVTKLFSLFLLKMLRNKQKNYLKFFRESQKELFIYLLYFFKFFYFDFFLSTKFIYFFG